MRDLISLITSEFFKCSLFNKSIWLKFLGDKFVQFIESFYDLP